MVKQIKTFSLLLVILVIPSAAVEEQDFYNLADSVLKGGNKYTLEEIQDVSRLTAIPVHHRAIVEVSMLGSIEEESRYLTAIAKATDYIEYGTVDWAKGYLRMQRGFVYGLIGDRAKGTKDLEAVLAAEQLAFLNSEKDPLLDIMRKRARDLELELDSLMRQTVGNYYMDFRKDGILPTEAFRFFSSIKSKPFRAKCLLQLRERLGEDEYATLAESMKNFDSENDSDTHESKTEGAGGRHENRKLHKSPVSLRERNNQIAATRPAPSNTYWFLGIGLILGLFLAFFLGRSKLFRRLF